MGLSRRRTGLPPCASVTGTSASRYARSALACGTKRSRGSSSIAAMMRGSVTSLVRTWPSTIMRRAAAKSVMLRIPRACERRLLAASGGKRQGTEYASSARPRESGDPDLGSGFPLEFTPRESGGGNERSFAVVGSLRQRLPAGSRSCIAGLAKRAANGYFASDIRAPQGHVAEWLRNGLQNRVPRFNSGRGLQYLAEFTTGILHLVLQFSF